MKIFVIKTSDGVLVPATQADMDAFRKIKPEQALSVEIKRARNIKFHRKMFALFNLAFDMWKPTKQEYKGIVVAKEFDRFRKDMTILAGFFTPVFEFSGEIRLEPHSLSFENMSEDRFAKVYKAVLSVVWEHILKNHNYANEVEVNRAVENLLRFES